jgi:hypothetical protein
MLFLIAGELKRAPFLFTEILHSNTQDSAYFKSAEFSY